jgi:hypothetical protein
MLGFQSTTKTKTSEGLVEMFEGDFADTCTEKAFADREPGPPFL